FGDARFRAFYCQATLAFVARPALRGLVEMGFRLLGATPLGLLKWTPRMWESLFHGLGRIEFESEPEPRLILRGMPAELMATGTSVLALAGSLDAVFTLTRQPGRVTVDEVHAATGQAIYGLHVDG